MIFNSVLDKIFEKIKTESNIKKRNKAYSYLEEQLIHNKLYNYQYNLLCFLKENKDKIKTESQLKSFLLGIRNKNDKFISENNITPLKVWKTNKSLMEYYNINPEEIVPSLLDKILDLCSKQSLNEEAIKSYIGPVESVKKTSSKQFIKESFRSIKESKLQKDLNTEFKVISFLSKDLDKNNKRFVHESLRKLRTMQKTNFNECVNKLYKLRVLSEKIIREFQEDSSLEFETPKNSPGKRVSLKDLKYVKKIQVETPRNYKDPERIFVSFQIPFFPVGAFFNEIRLSAVDIKKRLDRFETNFINKYIRPRADLFNPKGAIWQTIMREAGIKAGSPVNGRIKFYVNAKPGRGNTWEDYYNAIYDILKEYSSQLPEEFPDELTPKAQQAAIKQKDPNRQRAKRTTPTVKQKQSASRGGRRAKSNDEGMFDYGSDEFGGLF